MKVNKVNQQVVVKQNNLLENVEEEANVIVANILAEIILRFEHDAFKLLTPGGYFITSGIIQKKKDAVKQGLENAGFHILEVNQMEDWISIIAQKPEEDR
ncbi:ribosomal protein L11 methyltransferase [Gracilibacillus boraciitolerans JCM 21714]|uniref:Ribosomal protein L11 methyltransferase n=1 Tax=Gracilibacillus boraciitolerans JCM 21714 TaxID=1298598 RepID=W4VD64_9BACI|nr:ribosomal protein L11 methyltransferase [Gracilibacillus boraciitolerans JCM 21714]